MKVLGLLLIVCLAAKSSYGLSNYSFPKGVLFGGATAAYIVEGAYVEDGKGWSLWDNITHTYPEVISGTVKTGDVAADQYHRYKEDVALAASLGHDFYKFSVSWPRILPNGTLDNINQAGIAYYNNLINAIIEAGMEAHVVMFNFDIPMTLEKLGGFENQATVNHFADYANLLYKEFGDRVTTWITFNEAHAFCQIIPDSLLFKRIPQNLGVKEYQCGHNILKAHAKAYHNYHNNYKAKQGGQVGMAFSMYWYWPATNSALDIAAAERARSFVFDLFAHPIFRSDYPKVLKDHIGNLSKLEGRSSSRLPAFTEKEKKEIHGTYDFLGLNSFRSYLASHINNEPLLPTSTLNDSRISQKTNASFDFSGMYVSTPASFRASIKYASHFCHNCSIYFTEHGWGSNDTSVDDTARITFFRNYMDQILLAINEDKVKVKAYAVWQLLDGFYFTTGIVDRLGLIQVDFSSKNLTRTPRKSAFFFKNVIETRSLIATEF